MAAPSVTYSFSNSTTADATQVNQNFTDLINGLSDGTKDLTINALTCAGAVTLNGNVSLGNGTPDDITISGSLASSIAIKTTYSYDVGTSTIGLKSIYFGSDDSAARTVRLIGPTVATSSKTVTLPKETGTLDLVPAVTSQTSTYAILTSDETVVCSGASFTATLPTAVGVTGKRYKIVHNDSTLTRIYTIATTSAQTINGASTKKITTQYECLIVQSDGSNWIIVNRYIDENTKAYTAPSSAISNFTRDAYFCQRQGDSLMINLSGTFSGAGSLTSLTQANLLPSGLTMDTAKVAAFVAGGNDDAMAVGIYNAVDAGVVYYTGIVAYNKTADTFNLLAPGTGSAPFTPGNVDGMSITMTIPITNWEG